MPNLPAYQFQQQTIDDQNQPPAYPDQRFMPASPDDRNAFNPNVGDSQQRDTWIQQNVFSKGLTIDMKTNEIIDPDTGDVVGTIPDFYPMV